MSVTNRIEKQVTLRAPTGRVWQAITNAEEFGRWFGIRLDGPFVAGEAVKGTWDGSLDEAGIIAYQKSLGLVPSKVKMPDKNTVFCTVERLEPEHYFSFRWIPYGVDAEADPQNEATTLVEFRLEKMGQDTRLTIVESGFDQVPAHRRERAFRMNEGGWSGQAENIKKYVEGK